MNTFYVFFAAAIIASAKSPEMKASFNNTLPSQTKGVMVNPRNPENPDSKPSCCAHHLNQCPTLKNPRNPENPDSNNWLLRAPIPALP
jgi:hypothetical protein